MSVLIRIAINAIALWVAALLIPRITFGGEGQELLVTVVIVATIFGAVNLIVRPIVRRLTCAFYLLTLGLFHFILNAFMLLLTSWVAGQLDVAFTVDGFVPALVGSVVISLVSTLIDFVVPDDKDD